MIKTRKEKRKRYIPQLLYSEITSGAKMYIEPDQTNKLVVRVVDGNSQLILDLETWKELTKKISSYLKKI